MMTMTLMMMIGIKEKKKKGGKGTLEEEFWDTQLYK